MERKEITAYLIKCQPSEFMAYKDYGNQGVTVLGPEGKKYRFSNDQLDKAEEEIKRKAAAKKPVKKTVKRAAAKPKKQPAKKPGTAPKNA